MSNVFKFSEKQAEPRVSGENLLDGVNTGHLTDENKPLDGSLTAAFYMVRDILNQPKSHLAASEYASEATDVLTGALCLCRSIHPDNNASLTSLVTDTAKQYPQFTYRMLMDKSKALLISLGILVKVNNVKYRWANIDELSALLKGGESESNDEGAVVISPVVRVMTKAKQFAVNHKPQQIIDGFHRYQAKRNPWVEVLSDGSIQKHRKAFTGEYTADEKKAIREAHERQQYTNLLSKSAALTPDAQALAEKKQLEMIERKATMAAQMDTLAMWAKILAVLAIAAFVLNTLSNDGHPIAQSQDDDFLPSGIYGAE